MPERPRRSVQWLDVARISQAGINSDEEITHMIESASRSATGGRQMAGNISDLALARVSEAMRDDPSLIHVLTNLRAQETTYRSALAATTKAIQPSLAAFLQ